MSVTATDIKRLLAARHSDDVFVPECKDGPSGSGLGQIDAWAMRKSWARPMMIGYEVKVTRQDFLRDEKWPKYLPMCHQLYFVTPYGLVQPDEVPEVAGLIWVTKNGTKLYTKRKAQHRDIEPPTDVMAYVLMSRAQITRECVYRSERDMWAEWLERRRKDQDWGKDLSRLISRGVSAQIQKLEHELSQEQRRSAGLQRVAEELDRHGISWRSWGAGEALADRISQGIPPSFDRAVADAERAIGKLRALVDHQHDKSEAA